MDPAKAQAIIIELLNLGLNGIPPLARVAVSEQAKEALAVLFPAPVTEAPPVSPDGPKE